MSSVTLEEPSRRPGAGVRQHDILKLNRTDLRIIEGRKSVVYKVEEIGLHTDNPHVHIIGWYCAKQDESDGSSLLVDTGDLSRYFSQPEPAVSRYFQCRILPEILISV